MFISASAKDMLRPCCSKSLPPGWLDWHTITDGDRANELSVNVTDKELSLQEYTNAPINQY